MLSVFVLLTVFRMVVLPVQFEDRELATSRAQQEKLVRQMQDYFDRQFAVSGTTFRFELAPTVTLGHPAGWYGANYPDRKDIRLADAVREACQQVNDRVDFSTFDGDGDGMVDGVFLLFAGPGEHASGVESDIYPQQGRISADGSALAIDSRTVDRFAAAPEGEPGVGCHEIGHLLGLPDLYDTDGAESGGECAGLDGTSIMDLGCRQADFPGFGAVEYHLLGLGRSETLKTGSYVLTPLAMGQRYLRAETDRKDEYFLFEARKGELFIYHIDRSANPAGYSSRQKKDLKASERWELGEVNNNPEHPCARLVRLPGADGADSFGSDTPAAFRAWSGAASGLALTGIRPAADGAVAFDVIRPITLADLVVYQDAALLRWTPDPALTDIQSWEISWSDGVSQGSATLPADTRSYTLEGLLPRTEYTFCVRARCAATGLHSTGGRFTTKILRKGTYPYIYLGDATRNVDGSFPAGSKLPLRVFNATDVAEVHWTLDGAPVGPDADGFFAVRRSGVLRAKILYTDGTSETLLKEINVR